MNHTATLLADGRVLVVGGYGGFENLASTEVYDPSTGTWSPTGSMAEARKRHAATLLTDGRVLVLGGTDDFGKALASVEVYDPSTGTWSPTGSMAHARREHTATRLTDGTVLIAGGAFHGAPASNVLLASAELYDPSTGTWSPTGSMVYGRIQHTATRLTDGRVLVSAGFTDFGLSSAEVYDPSTNAWRTTTEIGRSP